MHRFSLIVAVLLAAVSTQAMITPVPLDERTEGATQIVYARLDYKRVYSAGSGQQLYTLYIFDVQAYLKSPGSQTQVAIIADGGQLGNRLQITHPNFYVAPGQEAVLFLQPPNEAEAYGAYREAYPDLLQCRPYTRLQGVVKYQRGRFFDIGSQAHYSPQEMLDTLEALTGFEGIQPNGEPFRLTGNPQEPALAERSTAITSLEDGTGGTGPFVAGTDEVANELVINGSGFGSSAGTVWFPNADDGGSTYRVAPIFPSDLVSWTDTQIRIKIPESAGSGTLFVDDSGGTTVGTTSIDIQYGVISLYTDFLNFAADVVFVPKLADQNGNGGYTFLYNNTQPSPGSDFASNTAAADAFERALVSWRCGTGVNFERDDSSTSISAPASDGTCVVAFDNLGAGTLGITNSYFSGTGTSGACDMESTRWYLNNADIRFNSATTWNFGPGATSGAQYDFETVALHELGHAHGLAHLIDGTDTEVMHYAIANGTDIRMLSAAETAGGGYLTGEGTAAPCLPSPGPMTALSSGCAALPVELLHFQARRSGSRAELEWATATELNNDYFTLERSADGRQYQEIAQVMGAGTVQQQRVYRFEDREPVPGINYYRLWQTDYDGQKTMIGERSLRFPTQQGRLWVFQVVQGGQLEAVYESTKATGTAELQLLNVQGRLMWNREVRYTGGRASIAQPLPNLPSGMYILQLQDGRRLLHQRLILHE
ncbi:MAG TPA: matrixin family metalloprotease [Phaeodactylibacter sp.]|nr:matrixin family metalloprotease [Phaeodactylibacter sp.]